MRLETVLTEYFQNSRPLKRLLWKVDRFYQRHRGRRTSKYVALAVLEEVLRDSAARGYAGPQRSRKSAVSAFESHGKPLRVTDS